MHGQQLLRTEIQDQRQPEWTRRGSRYWTHAEISSDMLFFVEGKLANAVTGAPRSRFITCNLSEALEIPSKYGLEAVDLFAYICFSEGAPQFGKVREALVNSNAEGFVFSLDSGMTFTTSPQVETRNSLGLRRVFLSRPD